MDAAKTGGPAFPGQEIDGVEYVDGIGNRHTYRQMPGMTLRDYFAAKALEAILRQLDRGIRPQDCIRAAEDAYFIADAMLKARA